MSLKIDGSSGITFPDTSVQSKSAQGPAFSVYQSAPQAIPANTFTKLLYNTEEFDIGGCFDTGTSRFQPTVAGYYQISGLASVGTTQCTMIISIYKSTGGGAATEAKRGMTVSNSAAAAPVSALIYLNGSTDYVELWTSFSTAQSTGNGLPFNYFQGFLARAA